jgi:hypothetical protein
LQRSLFFLLGVHVSNANGLGWSPPIFTETLTNWLRACQFFPFTSDLAVKVPASQFRLPGNATNFVRSPHCCAQTGRCSDNECPFKRRFRRRFDMARNWQLRPVIGLSVSIGSWRTEKGTENRRSSIDVIRFILDAF